ncbi:LysM peptidoglycan-binding domain-containing protein [uncultured Thiohalocapsa sp.]|uniref:LysM peptidoglycan-binding domain-containing protein n=1 Tax=uncultured Thiohalocapsa sp. TaxID=768990 RepID=UPI0025D7A7B2|nr:LysM peptidoglycan-binding domain-containing protein [uncultured Thiohalocapsa sp.]
MTTAARALMAPAALAAACLLTVVAPPPSHAAGEAGAAAEPAATGPAVSATEPVSTPDAAEDLRALRAELARTRRAQAQAEARVAELEAILTQQDERRQSTAMEHTAQLNAAELRTREHKQRLLDAEARIRALEDQLAERDERIAALQEAAAAARETLRERLEAVRARLPAAEGGSLTAAQARRQAEADARYLKTLVEDALGIDNPRLWGDVRSAENALHRSQFLLARADNARTVYRVRPGDSLRQVSLLFYGTGERWTELFEANRHVLQAPEQLLPGLTLVVP